MCIRDRAQAEQSCKNVGAILAAAGTGFDRVVKTTCFLADMADFAAFNEVYAKYLSLIHILEGFHPLNQGRPARVGRGVYRIHAGLVQRHRVKAGEHAHVRDDGRVVLGLSLIHICSRSARMIASLSQTGWVT